MERRTDPPICQFMARALHTVDTEDTIEKVEAYMNRVRVHALPVISEDGRVFGIITGNDLVRFRATKRNLKAVRAWELCTYKPLCVSPSTPTSEVAKLMLARRVHHVLVGNGDRLDGIVSSFDFVHQHVRSRQR